MPGSSQPSSLTERASCARIPSSLQSPGRGLSLLPARAPLPEDRFLLVRPGQTEPWLFLACDGGDHPVSGLFSDDGRYLTIGTSSGPLSLIDLEALEKEIAGHGW